MAAKGQVRKRGRSWQVDVNVNGERVRRSVGASKVEARRILEQLHEMPAPRGYAALGDILGSYLGSLRLRGKSRTIHQAGLHAARLEAFYGTTLNAIAVTAADIDAFVRQRRTEDVSPETINGALRVLRAALRLAADPGGPLEGRVPPRVKLLRVTRRIPSILEDDQLEALLASAPMPFDLMLLLAARAGLRHQEILHLQVRDIDLRGRRVRVSAKPVWTPKSHEERAVPIGERLAERLARHVESLGEQRPDAWLFEGNEGGPRVNAAEPVREIFRTVGLYEGVDRPGLHMLRRTFASGLLAKGVDLNTVRELGGWKDLQTVQRYLASTDSLKRAAIQALE